ncbi:MAG: amino acid permease [Candidatus Woesearchaeota archaeon]
MSGLKKVLSYRTVILITINSIMGTGIFFLPALGAGKAGPASLISWGLMGLISIYIAMCFAELTSMYPSAGGVYEFCKHAYGKSESSSAKNPCNSISRRTFICQEYQQGIERNE